MPGRAERLTQGSKARLFIQAPGRVHAGQGFQITGLIAKSPCDAQTMPQQRSPHTLTAHRVQEVHFAQFAHLEFPAAKRRDARAAHDFSRLLDHEVGRARCAVGLRHDGNFRVL